MDRDEARFRAVKLWLWSFSVVAGLVLSSAVAPYWHVELSKDGSVRFPYGANSGPYNSEIDGFLRHLGFEVFGKPMYIIRRMCYVTNPGAVCSQGGEPIKFQSRAPLAKDLMRVALGYMRWNLCGPQCPAA